jgi:hypothetical protein
MKKISLSALFLFCVTLSFAQGAPSNDECSGAITLQVSAGNSCAGSYSGTTGYATQSLPACSNSGTVARDVWFKFVATAANQRISLAPVSYTDYVYQVFEGTCTNLQSIACINTAPANEPDVALINALTPGKTYYLRVYDIGGGSSDTRKFTICINEATKLIDNDDCSGATEITPWYDGSGGDRIKLSSIGATQSMPGCYGTAEDDIWAKFTATSTRHRLLASGNSSYINPVIEAFSGDCAQLQSLGCVYRNPLNPYVDIILDLENLTPGKVYYYRIYGSGGNTQRVIISTAVATLPAVPANDEASGAILLSANNNNDCTSILKTNTGYATQSMPTCNQNDYPARDVWYKFVASSSAQQITVASTDYDNYSFQVFSGSPANLSSMACVNNETDNEADIAVLNNLIPGNTYYLRIYQSYGAASESSRFSVCVNIPVTSLANDNCQGAIAVTPSYDASGYPRTAITNKLATQSRPGCKGTAEDDVWMKFTATATRHRVGVSTSYLISPVLEVFKGACESLQSMLCKSIEIADPYYSIAVDLKDLTIGETYYYRVYGREANTERVNFETYVATLPAPPSNDDPEGAFGLSTNNDNSCNLIFKGAINFPSQSIPSCVPSGYDAADVWFVFMANSASHRITVGSLNYHDFAFEVFSGTPGNLVSLGCTNTGIYNESDVAVINNLQPYHIYYLRVWNLYGMPDETKRFSICVNTSSTVLNNDDCTGAIPITPFYDATGGAFTTVSNFGATQSLPGCYGSAEDDIWMKFTATSTRHRVVVSASEIINPVLEVFRGTCGSLESIACRYISNGSTHYDIDADLSKLVVGQTYYYRVYGSGNATPRGNINTFVSTLQSTLPVKLSDFRVEPTQQKNILTWKTSGEFNNAGFEIQYSPNGRVFDSLGFVLSLASGNFGTGDLHYSFNHNRTALSGDKFYYRLKQINNDNSITYSLIISATSNVTAQISIRQNPVRHNLELVSTEKLAGTYIITDLSGRVRQKASITGIHISVKDLLRGMYLLTLNTEKGPVTLKFSKL